MLSAVKLRQSSSISGPGRDHEAHVGEYFGDFVHDWLTGWTLPSRGGVGGQRHVETLGGELRLEHFAAFERGLARGERIGDGFAQRVDLRPLRLAFVRGHATQRLEQADTLPALPSAATRSASTASRSAAASISATSLACMA